MVTYDPRGMDWPTYCSLMAELFSAQEIGTVTEDRWAEWVTALSQLGNFSQSGVPDARVFSTWREWAEILVGVMSLSSTTSLT